MFKTELNTATKEYINQQIKAKVKGFLQKKI